MKHFYFLLFCLLIQLKTAKGQFIDFKKDLYWIDVGGGIYNAGGNFDGFSAILRANLIRDSILYKVRFSAQQEFVLFGPSPPEEFYTIGMLIGKAFSGKYGQIQFSGGLGISTGVKRGKLLYINEGWASDPGQYEEDQFLTPSIPLEVDLIFKPIKFAGIGITLYSDLNLKKPIYGLGIHYSIGKLR